MEWSTGKCHYCPNRKVTKTKDGKPIQMCVNPVQCEGKKVFPHYKELPESEDDYKLF